VTTIETDRLILRPASVRSIGVVVEWLNDREVTRYSEQRHQRHTQETQRTYLLDMHAPHKYMEIYCDNTLIGTMTAHVDENNSVADIGILIGNRSYWGNGYGSEAWSGLCHWLLDNGVRKIEAGTMACNYPMLNVFRKTQMIPEGRREGHFLFEKRLVDLVYYAKFRE